MSKVILLLPSFRGGGAERIFIDLAGEFLARGYDAELVVLSDQGEYASELPEALPVKILGTNRASQSILKLAKLFRDERPKVIISAITHINILAVLAKLIANIRTVMVVTEHNPYAEEKRDLAKHIRLLLYFGSFVTYRLVDNVIAVSEDVRTSLLLSLKLNPKTVSVIHNPINILRVQKLSTAPVELDSGLFQIITMGRLVNQKRHDLLIRAFCIVQREFTEATLLILGDGPLKNSLRDLACELGISHNVKFLGFQRNPFKFLARSRVFALSSDFEGFGNVIVEALALGVPVISTDCPGGPREILKGSEYGNLVPLGNIAALASALREVLAQDVSNPSEVQKRINRANDFTLAVAFAKYEALLAKPQDSKVG